MKVSFAVYFFLLHFLCGLALWKSDVIPHVKAWFMGITGSAEHSKHFHTMRRYHARSARIVPEGSVFFIGDSIIQGLCVNSVIQPAVNYGIGGDTTQGVLLRMRDYDFSRASAVVMSVGHNDLKYSPPEDIVQNMEKIISQIDPRLPVIVSSVLLVDESVRETLQGRNSSILRLNTLLRELSERSPRVAFFDHGNLTVNGGLRSELHDGDGVHPNNDGNRILAANLRRAILDIRSEWNKQQGVSSAKPSN